MSPAASSSDPASHLSSGPASNPVTDPASGHLPGDLLRSIRDAYEPAGMKLTGEAQREAESDDYGASRLSLDHRAVVFRVAKITPTKIGLFVTVWKRPIAGGEIAPLDRDDGVDFVVISTSDAARRGQFVFPQQALVKHGVMSKAGKGGKRGIRVYPPWCKPVVAEAIKTQKWQCEHFLPLPLEGQADPSAVRRLFQKS